MKSLNLGMPAGRQEVTVRAWRSGTCTVCGERYEKGEEVIAGRGRFSRLRALLERRLSSPIRHLNCERSDGPETAPDPRNRSLRAAADWPDPELELDDCTFVHDATDGIPWVPPRLSPRRVRDFAHDAPSRDRRGS